MFLISTHLAIGGGGKCQTAPLSREGIERETETENRENLQGERLPCCIESIKKLPNAQPFTFTLFINLYGGGEELKKLTPKIFTK